MVTELPWDAAPLHSNTSAGADEREEPVERFVVGFIGTRPGAQPLSVREICGVPGVWLWEAGHNPGEIEVTGAPGRIDTLLTAGSCLATATERRRALQAAARGELGPLRRLPGSHLIVVRTESGALVVGDRAGVVPVYWLPTSDGVWWSTAAAVLAARAGTEVELPLLLGEMMLSGVDVLADRSLFRSVRRVPPGGVLRVPGEAAPVVKTASEPPGPVSAREGALELCTALFEAVARWGQRAQRLSADLSGGVDSGIVCCLAATVRPLLAVTYTDTHLIDDDDSHYARRLADAVPSLTHRIVSGQGVYFDGLEDPAALPLTDSPTLTVGALTVKDPQMRAAAEVGSTMHLTGRGGDNAFCVAPTYVVDMLRAGRCAQALRQAVDLARQQRTAVWPVWRQLAQTAAISYRAALRQLASRLARPAATPQNPRGGENLAWCTTTPAARWLTHDGRAVLSHLVANRAASAPSSGVSAAALHERLAVEAMGAAQNAFQDIARARWGLAVHAPFLDNTVVDAWRLIPSAQRTAPGVYKPLARAAFTGLVPDFLLRRHSKTDFTDSVTTGLIHNARPAEAILRSSRLAAAGLIDGLAAVADLRAAVAGAPVPLAPLHHLLAVETWLAHYDTALSPAAWSPHPAATDTEGTA